MLHHNDRDTVQQQVGVEFCAVDVRDDSVLDYVVRLLLVPDDPWPTSEWVLGPKKPSTETVSPRLLKL